MIYLNITTSIPLLLLLLSHLVMLFISLRSLALDARRGTLLSISEMCLVEVAVIGKEVFIRRLKFFSIVQVAHYLFF